MGTASIVLGLVSMTICWAPGLGWLGATAGILACALGVPSVTHWFHKPGYGPWGISGIICGITGADLSLAYQVKYAGNTLDAFVVPLSKAVSISAFIFAAALCAAGLVLARTKNRPVGVLLAAIALSALVLVGAWGLITADRAYEAAARLTVSLK